MKATQFEFRFRMAIIVVIVWLGFFTPWIEPLNLGNRISTLEYLALQLSRTGLVSFTLATPLVIAVGALFAAIAAVLRVWGTAWLGPATVMSSQMKAGAVLADGPYRYVRNPLYLGIWFMIAALALTMPPTGAVFVVIAETVFYFRLILAEESFLLAKLGQPYADYLHAAPRLIPRLRSTLQPTGRKPDWRRGFLAETNPIGVFLILAILSWRYDNTLLIRAILVNFGLSLVFRAFLPAAKAL
jgi:protein-S-isoprenylcysteine O-methyltransferase Ste14